MDYTQANLQRIGLRPTTTPWPWRQLLLIMLLFTAVVVAVNWSVIRTANIEVGDFAANGLLVQDAKSFSLWTGNYSRVGFNHPGPAIMYVLAFGELVFHDWLHLVPSPFSGQIVGIALYTAFWMTSIMAMLRLSLGSTTAAAVTLAVFAVGIAYVDHRILVGMWFPNLYVLPFAAMLVAGARLVDGHTESLPMLAIACGFLINGHVSFVAILGIIFLTVLVGNFLLSRQFRQLPVLLSVQFATQNRRPLLRFTVILAIFLIPLLVETILRYPGPIADYIAYNGHNAPNTALQAFRYVGLFWGGTSFSVLLGAALGVMVLVQAARVDQPTGNGMRALAVTFVGATLALMFYAKFGIDMLKMKYIALFYYAVPTLLVALALGSAYMAWRTKRPGTGAVAIVTVLSVMTIVKIHEPVDYGPQYNQPDIAAVYASLKQVPHNGRLVIDQEWGNNAGAMWANMMGVQLYAKRRHENFFCIDQNWQISNTRAAQCTLEELARGPRLKLRWSAPGETVVAKGMDMVFTRNDRPDFSTTGEVSLEAKPELFKSVVLGSGWSAPERNLIWSDGPTAKLTLYAPPRFEGQLVLTLGAFLPSVRPTQPVTIEANGVASTTTFSQPEAIQQVRVPVRADAAGVIAVVLHIAKPVSQHEARMSADTRGLGVSLHALKLEGK